MHMYIVRVDQYMHIYIVRVDQYMHMYIVRVDQYIIQSPNEECTGRKG